MMKKIFILILVLVIVVSMRAMLLACSSSSDSGDSGLSVRTDKKCFACGKQATKKWRDGRWYCNKCYAYCETIWENS